jgi:hypothetical protein
LPTTTCSRCCRAVILVVVAIRIIVVMDGWMGGWIGDWMKTFSPTVFVLLCYTSKVWTYRYRINRSRRLRIAGETTTNVTRDREFGRRGNVNKGIFQRCVVRIQSMALMARNMWRHMTSNMNEMLDSFQFHESQWESHVFTGRLISHITQLYNVCGSLSRNYLSIYSLEYISI